MWLLYRLSVQREVEAFALRVLRHAEADKHLDHCEEIKLATAS
jgi:hypothetical protein